MVITRNQTIRDYGKYLESHPEEISELASAFLIKVPHFFRDPEAFDHLKENVLAKLIERGHEGNRTLRIWSAGCATGEEPYSLAMIMADLLGPELAEWNIKIFATDLDEAAINFARRGLYCESVMRDVPEEYRSRFFEPSDGVYRLSKALRQMIIFGQQDLGWSPPFPRIDLVVCRNMLIYFTPELQQRILDLFSYSLRHGGYLFLGKAETTWSAKTHFELVNKQWKIYRCKIKDLSHMLQRPEMQSPGLFRPKHHSGGPIKLIGKQAPSPEPGVTIEAGTISRFGEQLFRYLPVGAALIDRSYRILIINGPARRLLGLHDVSREQDFLHAARGIPYNQVRNTIDTAFRERRTVALNEVKLDTPVDGSTSYLSFTVALVPMDIEQQQELALITISDATQQAQTRNRLETAQAEQTKLLSDLGAANQRLTEVNKELLDAIEKLQSANEEMVLAHEELQATNEEFETTNEELQSTNEELETNNEELQATNEELEATNNELTMRTTELQELARKLSAERQRLTRMVELSPFYMLVLRGPQLIIETFSPRYGRLLGDQKAIGRPLAEIFSGTEMAEFVKLAREVYDDNVTRTVSRMHTYLHDRQNESAENYFAYTIVPTHDSAGDVDGVIVYAVDMAQQRLKEIEEELQKLKLIVEHCKQVALGLYDAQTTQLLQASTPYLDLLEHSYKYNREGIVGRKWEEVCLPAPPEEGKKFFDSVLKSGKPSRWPKYHSKPAGEQAEKVWDWGLTPVSTTATGGVRYVVYSAIDITEQLKVHE